MKVVVKKKKMMHCADCGNEMAEGQKKCSCGSMNISKSLIIIRKETAESGEELPDDDVDDDDVDVVDIDVEDDIDVDDEDDDDEDDDEDEDDDDDVVEPVVAKSLTGDAKKVAFVEALNLSTALAESITKILGSDISKAAESYEDVMTDFNTVLDTAFDTWVSGESVSKADDVDAQTQLISTRIHNITKEGGAAMPTKITRPESLDTAELPDDIKAYITSLESGEPVEKKDDDEEVDIYKGLSPEVANIVKKAEATNEQNEAQKFIDVAKGFTHIPGDKTELAKSLRHASETDEAGYKVLVSTLTATNENLSQSDVFKSYGKPGAKSGDSEVSKRHADAVALVEKGDFATVDQAEVSLMDGSDYAATNN